MSVAAKRLSKAARIILIGAPGVGKGTQTERLISRYPQLASLSSGDILRDHVRKKSPLGTLRFLLGESQGRSSDVLDYRPTS